MASLALTTPLHRARRPASRSLCESTCSLPCVYYPTSFFSLCSTPRNTGFGFPSSRNLPALGCRAGSTGPPAPPPEVDPPPVKSQQRFAGIAANINISRFQEGMRIFFAVLSWLSLFFWASALDDDRHNKGNRFRR